MRGAPTFVKYLIMKSGRRSKHKPHFREIASLSNARKDGSNHKEKPMESFDIVSEVNMHEVTNAVDQAKREVSTRFDFKGSDARFEHSGGEITLHGDSEFQLKQMRDILSGKFTQRKIDLKALIFDKVEEFGKGARQKATVRQGVETEMARKMVKMIKDMKMKVQAAIQGDQVRVSGKKRDDLQKVMAMLRDTKLDIPLQFVNFRH